MTRVNSGISLYLENRVLKYPPPNMDTLTKKKKKKKKKDQQDFVRGVFIDACSIFCFDFLYKSML